MTSKQPILEPVAVHQKDSALKKSELNGQRMALLSIKSRTKIFVKVSNMGAVFEVWRSWRLVEAKKVDKGKILEGSEKKIWFLAANSARETILLRLLRFCSIAY